MVNTFLYCFIRTNALEDSFDDIFIIMAVDIFHFFKGVILTKTKFLPNLC